ncbi:lysozyme C-like isoform X1 [Penaeus chinensis]|uniref:lysozyme C-like isoform X1 n=1 Tax=Penaeus chinensis TaxID=139456 RepID=UPI001FB5886E|nr:lysozyme C-like isoform X1 [Penaeus chinensis]
MLYRTLTILLLAAVSVSAKIFEKCELASLLETKHQMPREDVKKWTCIAEYESTFNSAAINTANWDGSKDYGLFQLNNKYWCGDEYGKNVCGIPCSALQDDDLTDDLACARKVIKDTERWKGKGEGLTAWVAYVNRCQNRNLDEYISECWTGDETGSNIINIKNESPIESADTENEEVVGVSAGGDSPIINNVRIPIQYQVLPIFHSVPVVYPSPIVMRNPYGYVYQHVLQQ